MRVVAFHAEAFNDYSDWANENPKIFERIRSLIKEAALRLKAQENRNP